MCAPNFLRRFVLQHHDQHKLNYARAAKEEMHEVAVSPHPVALVGRSGVEAWDRVSMIRSVQLICTLPHIGRHAAVATIYKQQGLGCGKQGGVSLVSVLCG